MKFDNNTILNDVIGFFEKFDNIVKVIKAVLAGIEHFIEQIKNLK